VIPGRLLDRIGRQPKHSAENVVFEERRIEAVTKWPIIGESAPLQKSRTQINSPSTEAGQLQATTSPKSLHTHAGGLRRRIDK
jgi:hypothetical protein